MTKRSALSFTVLLLLLGCTPTPRHQAKRAAEPAPSLDRARLAAAIERVATEAQPGILGVGVQVLGASESWYLDADRPLPMQSVFKAPLAACVLDAVDRGTLKLDSTLVLTSSDLSVQYSPVADAFPARAQWTIQELLERAVETSDNTAADVLMRLIGGPSALTAWLNDKGIAGIRVDRYERDLQPAIWGLGSFHPSWAKQDGFDRAKQTIPLAKRREAMEIYLRGGKDSMTPRGGIAFLDALAAGHLVSPASTARLLDLMTKAMTGPNRLRAGLPAGATLAHKTGTGPTVLGLATATNDIGIVTLADGRRVAIVALLSASPQGEAARDSTLANVAREVAASVREARP